MSSKEVWQTPIWQNHLDSANIISNWKSTSKNDLIRMWVEYDKQEEFHLRDGVFSAIILKYWHKIGKALTETKEFGGNFEDCYEMLVDTLLEVLKNRAWENESTSIYNDVCGPDKAVSQVFNSKIKRMITDRSRDKRKANQFVDSLEELSNNGFDFPYYDTTIDDMQIIMIIADCFTKHKDVDALILHSLTFDDVYKTSELRDNNFSPKLHKLYTAISSYNDEEIDKISSLYNVDTERIRHITSLNEKYLKRLIRIKLNKMGSDEKLREELRCY